MIPALKGTAAAGGADVSETVSGAEAMLRVLERWGVDHVFTCPGSTEAAFLDAIVRHPSIRLVLTTHESIAVSMADGYARVTGRPAVAYLHANVGLANGIAHLYAAQLAGSPVVVLNGMKATSIQNRGGFTTAPHMSDFVRQYVKSDVEVRRPASLAEDVNRSLRVAAVRPQGPTWLGIPQDHLEAEVEIVDADLGGYQVGGQVEPLAQDIAAAAKLLLDAERPLIVAGSGLAKDDGVRAIIDLADRLGAPVVADDRRTLEYASFPADHRCFAGAYDDSRPCVAEADVIFFAGSRGLVEFEPPLKPGIPPSARVIHLHENPLEVGRVYGADVPLVGNPSSTLQTLLTVIGHDDLGGTGMRRQYLDRCRAEHQSVLAAQLGTSVSSPVPPIRVTDLALELRALLDDRTTVVSDSTTSSRAFMQALALSGACRFHTTTSGSLGWGVGAALGIQLAEPSRRVLALLGDGVFQFGVAGLWTAAYYKIPVTFLVVNNQSYAAVGAALRRHGGPSFTEGARPGVDISGPNITAIAEGFGVPAMRVSDLEQLRVVMPDLHSLAGPSLIEVMTDVEDLGP